MAKRAIVRIGDPTTHGGVVMTGISKYNVYGKEAAGIGDTVFCPRCEGHHVIVGGVHTPNVFGRQVAVEGMFTSCGAQVISTLPDVVFDVPDGDGSTTQPQKNNKQAYDEQVRLYDKQQTPLANCPYTIRKATGEVLHGVTDATGLTERIHTTSAETFDVYIGHRQDL